MHDHPKDPNIPRIRRDENLQICSKATTTHMQGTGSTHAMTRSPRGSQLLHVAHDYNILDVGSKTLCNFSTSWKLLQLKVL